jgi:hypothetical protein
MTQQQPLAVAASESKRLEERALSWPEKAQALQVKDQASYDTMGEYLSAIVALRDEAEAHHRPMIKAAYAAHQATLDGLKRIDEPLKKAEQILRQKNGEWEREQERVREQQARLLREAEEKRHAEELDAQIAEAEAGGATVNEVVAIIEQAPPPPPVVAPPTFERASFLSKPRDNWQATITSWPQFLQYVVTGEVKNGIAHPECLGAVMASPSGLNAFAKLIKHSVRVPGLTVTNNQSTSVRR